MKIETLDRLIKESKGSGASAEYDTRGRVQVSFRTGGKAYTYTGSVYRIAERMGLIPKFIITDESERVLSALARGETYVTTLAACDTVKALGIERGIIRQIDWRTNLKSEYFGRDEFDRELAEYSLE